MGTSTNRHWSIKWLSILLKVFWIILLFLTALVVIFGTMKVISPDIFGEEGLKFNIELPIEFAKNISLPDGLNSLEIQELTAQIPIDNDTHHLFGIQMLFVSLYLIFIIWMTKSLRSVISNIKLGHFFIQKNAIYFKRISIAFFCMFIVDVISQYFISAAINNTALFSQYQVVNFPFPDIELFLLFLLSLVFSQVFRNGVELKNENELTI
ncbi:MAG: hypothetical protein ACI9G9_000525 [Psychromonas sp.]|jgi:hypothetical protein